MTTMAAARARRLDDAHEDKRQGDGGKRPAGSAERKPPPEGGVLPVEPDGHCTCICMFNTMEDLKI